MNNRLLKLGLLASSVFLLVACGSKTETPDDTGETVENVGIENQEPVDPNAEAIAELENTRSITNIGPSSYDEELQYEHIVTVSMEGVILASDFQYLDSNNEPASVVGTDIIEQLNNHLVENKNIEGLESASIDVSHPIAKDFTESYSVLESIILDVYHGGTNEVTTEQSIVEEDVEVSEEVEDTETTEEVVE